MKVKISFFTSFLVILLTMSSCTNISIPKNDFTSYSNTIIDSGFNTFITLNAYTDSQENFDNYFNKTLASFKYYNKLFDIYNNYDGINNLKTINDNAGIKAVKVDEELIDLLTVSFQYNELADNFDITSGSLLKIWHTYREDGKIKNQNNTLGDVPNLEDLIDAKNNIGSNNVIIDQKNSTVFITNPNTSIDVGGIAKGYTVEKIAEMLEKDGLDYGVVNAGGNNRVINGKPDASKYRVGVQDPSGYLTDSLVSFEADNKSESFVTSGDYQNYYDSINGRYHHLINLDTMYPATYFRSVTVICESSTFADFLSTALFTMPYKNGVELIDQLNTDSSLNIRAIWVLDYDKSYTESNTIKKGAYTIIYSPNLMDSIS